MLRVLSSTCGVLREQVATGELEVGEAGDAGRKSSGAELWVIARADKIGAARGCAMCMVVAGRS